MKIVLNGRLVPRSRARVSVFDHGFLYGDGVYETVRAYGGRIFHWPAHYRRLKASAARLTLACPWSSRVLLRALERLLRANRTPDATVRITIARGPGSLGLDPALCPAPTLALLPHPSRNIDALRETGVSIGITRVRRNHPACLDPEIKSNNALNTILAKMEAKRMGVFEGVLLNLDGYLTEGTTSNLFFAKRNVLHTPALSCGLLEGITRGAVIRLARKAGFRVKEGRYTLRDLKGAEEVFLSSTTLEIMPVTRVVDRHAPGRRAAWRLPLGPAARRLHALFQAEVTRETAQGRNRVYASRSAEEAIQ